MPQRKTLHPAQIVKGIILLVALALLVRYIVTHLSDFEAITQIEFRYILPVILLSGVNFLMSCMRFYLTLTHLAHRIPFLTVLKYFTHGRFLNRFLPLGGSVYRAIMFKKTDGVSYKKYVAINLSFDWLNILTSTLLGVTVIALYDPRLGIGSLPLLPLFGAALVLLIGAIPAAKAALALVGRTVSRESIRKRMDEASEILEGMTSALKNRTVVLGSITFITLIIVGQLICYHLLFKSIAVDTDLAVLLVFLIILRFFRVIRITPANLGIREFLLGFLTYSQGAGAAEGILISLLMRVIIILVQGGLSLVIVAAEGAARINRTFRSP